MCHASQRKSNTKLLSYIKNRRCDFHHVSKSVLAGPLNASFFIHNMFYFNIVTQFAYSIGKWLISMINMINKVAVKEISLCEFDLGKVISVSWLVILFIAYLHLILIDSMRPPVQGSLARYRTS